MPFNQLNYFNDLQVTFSATVLFLSVSFWMSVFEDFFGSDYLLEEEKILDSNIEYSISESRAHNIVNAISVFAINTASYRAKLLLRAGTCSAAFFIFSIHQNISVAFLLISLIFNLAIGLRSRFGLDGTYHMSMLILPCSILIFVMPSKLSLIVQAYFCSQMVLCYLASGFVKMYSKVWRTGECLSGIFSTDAYGHPAMMHIFRFGSIAFVAAWIVMIGEILIGLSSLMSDTIFYSSLIFGVLLHFSFALFMGLNKFFWTWLAAYPLWIFSRNGVLLLFG